MKIEFSKLKKISVFTKSEVKLGKIKNAIINIDSHCIDNYEISANILAQKLLINPSQILSVSEKKIIVADNIEDQKVAASADLEFKTNTVSTPVESQRD